MEILERVKPLDDKDTDSNTNKKHAAKFSANNSRFADCFYNAAALHPLEKPLNVRPGGVDYRRVVCVHCHVIYGYDAGFWGRAHNE